MTITNGTLKYGQTVKTGDYENKRADVELSFTCAEGEDINEKMEHVKSVARHHLHSLLSLADTTAKPAVEKPAGKKAVKLPKEEKPAPAEEDDPLADRAPLPTNAPKPSKVKEEKVATAEDDDPLGIDDLIDEEAQPAKEVTDKELTDATQKCQAANKNAPAIRKILAELGIKTPPGRIIDLPQEKRHSYLDKLKEVKPLA
jgi:hypothetical protein